MNLFERAGLALRVLFDSKAAATMIPSYLKDPQWTDYNLHNLVTKGYTKNELIWRCIQERSGAASAPRIKARNKRTGEPIDDHPILDLLYRPNHRMSHFDLWSISIIYADLTGTAYWEQVRGPLGNTVQLWPLRPDRLHPVPHPIKVVGSYVYKIPGLEDIVIPAENVVEYQVFDPLSLYRGIAPAEVAARSLDVDISETNYLKLFFEGGGMPPGLIKTKKKLVDSDVSDIRRRWRDRYGGYKKWLEPAVLDMDAEFQKTGFSFSEMGFDVLDARSEVRVAMAFMIPPVLIGARVGLDRATFANYHEARTAFWEDTMIDIFSHLLDTFQREIADEEWSDVELFWDFSQVPVLFQKNIDQRIQHRADFLAGGLLLDEYRLYMGLPSLPGDSGKVRVQSLAFQIIPEGELGQLVPLKQPVGVGDTKSPRKISDVLAELKSPPCRQKGETEQDCVSRKIPELYHEHPEWEDDQVVAAAHSMCGKPCSKMFEWEEELYRDNGKKEGEGPLPDDDIRNETIARSIAKTQEVLDEQSERIIENVG